jgi:hypothetical protein
LLSLLRAITRPFNRDSLALMLDRLPVALSALALFLVPNGMKIFGWLLNLFFFRGLGIRRPDVER